MFDFCLQKKSLHSHARAGLLTTTHGMLETPAFMPCATLGTVKSLSPRDLQEIGISMLVANTYHLFLQPGLKVMEKCGGLHSFMGWSGPLLTDSGGFQVFSLGLGKQERSNRLGKEKTGKLAYDINSRGVWFKSHINGSRHFLSPEKSIKIQEILGADIILAFDECPPADCGYEYTQKAMHLTHRWAEHSVDARTRRDQALFGIVQGGIYEDLREQSAQFISRLPIDGFAIGGLAVGEKKKDMQRVLDLLAKILPEEKPRHLLGVGTPEDILAGVSRGVDLFDCVLPTRIARNGSVFTKHGRLNLKNAQFLYATKPIEEDCTCYTCQHFSRAYLRHLFKANEILGAYLATYHNVYFLVQLMKKIREAIHQERFEKFAEAFLFKYKCS